MFSNSTAEIFNNPAAERISQWLRIDNPLVDGLEYLTRDEWEATLSNAIWSGLAPLCYLKMKTFGKLDLLPADIHQEFKRHYFASGVKVMQHRQALKAIQAGFNFAKVPFILLKGGHLAEVVYQDPAARLMTDLDLMVARRDLDRASEVIVSQGYQPGKKYWSEFETTFSHQLPTFSGQGLYPIELHWTILLPDLPFKIDIDGLWERKQTIKIDDFDSQVLSPEDLLLHLGLHAAAQHKLTGGLRLIYDIALVLNVFGKRINWQELSKRCSEWNAKIPMLLVFQLCDSIFGIGAPEAFLEGVNDIYIDEAHLDAARGLLFLNKDFHPEFSRNFAEFLEKKSLIEKFKFASHRLIPPKIQIAEDYPVLPNSPRVWLYYPSHWLALLKKHIGTLFGVIKKDETTLKAARWSFLVQEREDYLHRLIIGQIKGENTPEIKVST